jgi:hypothetical protein
MDIPPDDESSDLPEGIQLLRLLWDDVLTCDALRGISSSPSERRQFLRSMFAYVEAGLWLFKQAALQQYGKGAVAFSPSELALLAEISPVLDIGGVVQEQPANLRFPLNVLFTMQCHARAYHYDCLLQVGDHRWDGLRRSAQVRNRLMHPKNLASMIVSDDELLAAQEAIHWFNRVCSASNLEAAQ